MPRHLAFLHTGEEGLTSAEVKERLSFFGKTVELVKIAKPKSHEEEVMVGIINSMMYFAAIGLFKSV